MATWEISEIAKTGVAKNFSFAQITFKLYQGEPVTCKFSLPMLERISITCSELINHIRSRSLARRGHPAVSAIEVKRAAATAAVGGERVLVSFRSESGILHIFALSPDQSAQLRNEMQSAETHCHR